VPGSLTLFLPPCAPRTHFTGLPPPLLLVLVYLWKGLFSALRATPAASLIGGIMVRLSTACQLHSSKGGPRRHRRAASPLHTGRRWYLLPCAILPPPIPGVNVKTQAQSALKNHYNAPGRCAAIFIWFMEEGLNAAPVPKLGKQLTYLTMEQCLSSWDPGTRTALPSHAASLLWNQPLAFCPQITSRGCVYTGCNISSYLVLTCHIP